jgi:hypothetical protein
VSERKKFTLKEMEVRGCGRRNAHGQLVWWPLASGL